MLVRGDACEARFHICAVDGVDHKRVSGGTDAPRSSEVKIEAVPFQKILGYLCADVPAPEKDAQGRVPFLRWERIQPLGRVCRGWYEHLRDADKPHPLGDFRLPRVVGAARSTPGPTTAPSLRVRSQPRILASLLARVSPPSRRAGSLSSWKISVLAFLR